LCFLDFAFEELIEQKVRELGILFERFFDPAQKAAANDATATPH